MSIRPGSYDTKCYELAESFLSEEPSATEKHTNELATLIQQTIEDYIDSNLRKEAAQ